MNVFIDLYRVVNVASRAGYLKNVTSQELKNKFTSESLTEDELKDLVAEYVR